MFEKSSHGLDIERIFFATRELPGFRQDPNRIALGRGTALCTDSVFWAKSIVQ
jgi:hypothetical protein